MSILLAFLIERISILSHAEKNKVVGERWRRMTVEEKEPYYERAKEGRDAVREVLQRGFQDNPKYGSRVCIFWSLYLTLSAESCNPTTMVSAISAQSELESDSGSDCEEFKQARDRIKI